MKRHAWLKQGFTLIELLIVVAIIAILAAIAVPNFLEAQMRAKVSRAKTDMRTASLAVECYMIDWNVPPPHTGKVGYTADGAKQINRYGLYSVWCLSTPVAYLTSTNMPDPFCHSTASRDYLSIILPYGAGGTEYQRPTTYYFVNILGDERGWQWGGGSSPMAAAKNHWSRYLIVSLGPDYLKGPDQRPVGAGIWGNGNYCNTVEWLKWNHWSIQNYDPTNGTKSGGDILRWQGGMN